MSGAEAAVLGFWLPVLTRAIMKAVGAGIQEGSWNVLQANGNDTPTFLYIVVEVK
jgi:hypothetical protein